MVEFRRLQEQQRGLDPGGWRMTIETQTGMVMSYLAREIGIL